MESRSGSMRLAWGIVASAALASAQAATPAIDAVWKVQQFSFEYRGESTFYTCGGMRQKLRTILTRLGAHPQSVKLTGVACDPFGRTLVHITVASPVEATAENLDKLTTYTSEQELIARARGKRLPRAEDLTRFPAHWETVSFAQDRRMRLEPGDCELIRQLSRSIFPHLTVQVIDDKLRCSPYGRFQRPKLVVAALVAASPD